MFRLMVGGLFIGSVVLIGRQVEAQETTDQGAIPSLSQTAPIPGDMSLLWQRQMKEASLAMGETNYAGAELNCAKALKIAGQFDFADMRRTASLVLLAKIYQAENRPDLAERTFLDAIAGREAIAGTNSPSLIMPLENLAEFYYFAERRYDLATPVSLRILHLVEDASFRDDAEVERRALAVAVVYRVQKHYAEAEPFYKQFMELAEKNNDLDLQDDLLATAAFYHDWGKSDQAELLCQRVLTREKSEAASNNGPDSQMKLAVALYEVAENYRFWGRAARAEPLYRESLQIIQTNASAGDSDLVRPLAGLAATLSALGETNGAAAFYRQAFTLAQKSLGPEDVLVKNILNDYGTLLDRMNLSGEAKSLRMANQWQDLIDRSQQARHVNALPIAEQMAGEAQDIARNFEPSDTRLGKTQVQLAEIYRQQNKTNQAGQAYAAAIMSFEKAAGTNSPELVTPLEYEADFYYTTKVQYDRVVSIYLRILTIVRSQPGRHPLEIARWERNLADVYRLQGKAGMAESGYLQALAMAEAGTNSVDDQVQDLQLLADFYQTSGRGNDAELMANRALALREWDAKSNAGNDAQLGIANSSDLLAHIYLAQNKPGQAELLYARSLEIIKKIQGPQSFDLLPRLVGLADASRAQKKFEVAEIRYKQALSIAETNDPTDATVREVLVKYAVLLQDMDRKNEAKLMLTRADTIHGQNRH